jgi:hypothetical protein
MSELAQTQKRLGLLRARLLMAVASGVLLASTNAADASDDDRDRPVVWIELGGQLDQLSHDANGWLPPDLTPPISNPSPPPFGRPPILGYDGWLQLSLQPEDSDWIYAVSLRYGRAKFGPKEHHDQSYILKSAGGVYPPKYILSQYNFANSTERSQSNHTVIDFTAGKDVGLGMFGHGRSVLNFGLRYAQLNEGAIAQLTAFVSAPAKYSPGEEVHKANARIDRHFVGIGPSASWDASVPVIGSLAEGLSLDWGANAAALFGRQKSRLHLQTHVAQYRLDPAYSYFAKSTEIAHSTHTPFRRRTVFVPNVGGFASVSYHLSGAAKLSVGYRADFFFNAIDTGVYTRSTATRGFYGPFASISIGIGG